MIRKKVKRILKISIFCFVNVVAFANDKREEVVNFTLIKVVDREKFQGKCYKDHISHSIGYGDYHYCDRAVKDLKNRILKRAPHLKHKIKDEDIRKYVEIDEDVALWLARSFLRKAYDNMARKKFHGKRVVDILNKHQLSALLDNAYNRGETLFYKDPLWHTHVKNIVKNKIKNKNKKMNFKECHLIKKVFLVQAKNSRGILARRFEEVKDFTKDQCDSFVI